MISPPERDRLPLSPAQARQVDEICDAFERAWRVGDRPRIEDALAAAPEPVRAVLLDELLGVELVYRRRQGEQPLPEEYRARFPGCFAGADESPAKAETAPPPATEPSLRGPVGWVSVPGYELLAALPAGGMGVLYKARDLSLGRIVALKVIVPQADVGPQWLARFHAEAQAIAALDHPNVVRIYHYGQHATHPYFVMEFLEGGSLAQKLQVGPLLADETARIAEVLARAVAYVHGKGIIHRDLKPANVMFAADGGLRLVDFGLAKRLDADQGLTASQAVLGTITYMPPEQAAGKPGDVGPAVDIYALGAIVYECLTGRPPFQGETWLETLDQLRFHEVLPPSRRRPDVPAALEAVCLRCLAKKPADRYASAADVADDLRRFLAEAPPGS